MLNKNKYVTVESVYNMLNEIGGCGATIDFNGTVYVTNRIITDIRHITNNPLPFTELIERAAV